MALPFSALVTAASSLTGGVPGAGGLPAGGIGPIQADLSDRFAGGSSTFSPNNANNFNPFAGEESAGFLSPQIVMATGALVVAATLLLRGK